MRPLITFLAFILCAAHVRAAEEAPLVLPASGIGLTRLADWTYMETRMADHRLIGYQCQWTVSSGAAGELLSVTGDAHISFKEITTVADERSRFLKNLELNKQKNHHHDEVLLDKAYGQVYHLVVTDQHEVAEERELNYHYFYPAGKRVAHIQVAVWYQRSNQRVRALAEKAGAAFVAAVVTEGKSILDFPVVP